MEMNGAGVLEIKKILVATTNKGKFKEISSMLSSCLYRIVSLSEMNIDVDVPETGHTLEENAYIKARAYSLLSGMVTLADDSGLEVDALDGQPGPLSARYAGVNVTDAERNEFLLKKMHNVPELKRTARFRCVMVLAWNTALYETYIGECFGRINQQPVGNNGFGYDSVFFLPQMAKTMAELTLDEKNLISHRSVALRKVAKRLTAETVSASTSI